MVALGTRDPCRFDPLKNNIFELDFKCMLRISNELIPYLGQRPTPGPTPPRILRFSRCFRTGLGRGPAPARLAHPRTAPARLGPSPARPGLCEPSFKPSAASSASPHAEATTVRLHSGSVSAPKLHRIPLAWLASTPISGMSLCESSLKPSEASSARPFAEARTVSLQSCSVFAPRLQFFELPS